MKNSQNLYSKYDVQVPRYTSYPPVPCWENKLTSEEWLGFLTKSFEPQNSSWSMYLHIPFCESLCTFCGCNTVITKNHKKESPYIETLLKEWQLYLAQVPMIKKRSLRHLHLGGGTPTFLSPSSLEALLSPIFSQISKEAEGNFEASIEVDPRRTTTDQLKVLRQFDFNRISLGVQDFNEHVQKLVNRIQPFEITEKITTEARRLGYQSVNFDLIYGLPAQTLDSMKITMDNTLQLRPDRIALYSFALVPWIKPAQRLFKDEDLPQGEEKRRLYEQSREHLLKAGYLEIGMDHFALPSDSLSQSIQSKKLHRNFMGYTDQKSDILLGLGVSSISETPNCFHQNEKVLPQYESKILKNQMATHRGHVLTVQDQVDRKQILQLMTQFRVPFVDSSQREHALKFYEEMIKDQIVVVDSDSVTVTEKGKPFLRNACLFFDSRLNSQKMNSPTFSKAL